MITKKICLITCYYGKFPEYFPLWLESCGRNQCLDFLLVTDIDMLKYVVPENVHILNESFIQLKQRFQRIIDFRISLEKPYKLCDYKPIYGLAFQEKLQLYDFWGYCDIDMIFGDVRKFLTDQILNQYDKLFDYGHFMLYRNCGDMNQLFRLHGANYSYKKVFSHGVNFAFDEMFGMNKIAKKNHIKTYHQSGCKDIGYAMYGMVTSKEKVHEEIFYIEKGHLYGAENQNHHIEVKEYMYIHFSKKRVYTEFDIQNIPKSYYVSINGCKQRSCKGDAIESEVNRYTDYKSDISKKKCLRKWKFQHFKKVVLYGSILEKQIYFKNMWTILKKQWDIFSGGLKRKNKV